MVNNADDYSYNDDDDYQCVCVCTHVIQTTCVSHQVAIYFTFEDTKTLKAKSVYCQVPVGGR